MATIERRMGKNGTAWRVKIRQAGHPTQTRTFNSRSDAIKWARAVEANLDTGEFNRISEHRSMTLADALDRYEREITPTKRGATQERWRIGIWRRTPLAGRPLADIRGMDIAAWRDKRRDSGISGQTIRNDLNLLSGVYRIARTEWGIEDLRNPVQNVLRPKGNPPRDRRLLPGEEERLLAVADARWRAIITLAIETGMRRGELLGLRWSHVDLKQGVARLDRTKNGSARDVPLSQRAIRAFSAFPRKRIGTICNLSDDQHWRGWHAVLDAAGITGLTFHDLRHEATSRLVESGQFTMVEIAAITGHKTLAMLQRYYTPDVQKLRRKLG